MPVQRAIERQLMDCNDLQTYRSWRFEISDGFVTIRRCDGGEHLLLLRVGDIAQFCADLTEIAEASDAG